MSIDGDEVLRYEVADSPNTYLLCVENGLFLPVWSPKSSSRWANLQRGQSKCTGIIGSRTEFLFNHNKGAKERSRQERGN